MSITVEIILLVSAIVMIFFSVAVFFFTKYKVKKIKDKLRTEEAHKYDAVRVNDPIKKRGDTLGELLWDLKSKTKNPLDDISLEYIINTSIRNGFKTFKVVPEDNYIEKSLIQLAKSKNTKDSKELIIIKNQKEINDIFDKEYKNLKKGGMIFIVESSKTREIKKLLSYTKLTGIRREFAGIGKGMVIVAK